MIINITDKNVMALIGSIFDKESSYLQAQPTENMLLSERLNDVAQEKGLIVKGAEHRLSPEEESEATKLLTYDPLYLTSELLEEYLGFYYPEASFNYKTLELEGMEYKGTFLEDLLESMRANLEDIERDPETGFSNLIFTPCFYIKDLAFSDFQFSRGIQQQLGILKRNSIYFPENTSLSKEEIEQAQKTIKEAQRQWLKEALAPDNFEALIRKAMKIADRFEELKAYQSEIKKYFQCDIEGSLLRTIVIKASDEDFSRIIDFLSSKKARLHPPADYAIPKPREVQQMFYQNCKGKYWQVSNHNQTTCIIRTRMGAIDARDRQPKQLNFEDFRLLIAINEFYKKAKEEQGETDSNQTVKCKYAVLYNFMGFTGKPSLEELIDLAHHVEDLNETKIYKEYEMIETEGTTSITYRLNPKKVEELPYFENCKTFTIKPTAKKLAIEEDRLVHIGKTNAVIVNQNDTESAAFEIIRKPVIFEMAEEMEQIYSMSYRTFCTGRKFKSERGNAIFFKLTYQLSFKNDKASWTRKYTNFFEEIVSTKSELTNSVEKRKLMETLERVLNHLVDNEKIEGYNIERNTGCFCLFPTGCTEKGKKKILKGFKQMISETGYRKVKQRVFPDESYSLPVLRKEQRKNAADPKKQHKKYSVIQINGVLA